MNTTQALFRILAISMYVMAYDKTHAQAFTPVNLSNQANFSWFNTSDTDPGDGDAIFLPGAPNGSVTLEGIPFNIASNGDQEQAWSADVAAGDGNAQVSITIPVGIYGVTEVYTLINSLWGIPGPTSYASLIFTGSAGATYTYALIGGSDIRNWLLGGDGPTYSINGTSTLNVYSGSTPDAPGYTGVLDMQMLVLPPTFATQTLTSVELIDNGARYSQRTVLDGVTVQTPGPQAIINIQKAVYLTSKNLLVGSNYQIQASSDLINWANQGSVFTPTNSNWQSTNYWNVNNWNQLFFKVQLVP